jgi:uncharacterized protein YcsI (UPF0317 family)
MQHSPSAAESRSLTRGELERASPAEVRRAIREGRWRDNTKRLALGYHQANVTIVPERYALDFMRFCFANPRPLPLLDVTETGDPTPRKVAPGADLRTDVAEYLVLRDGQVAERVRSLEKIWRKDHVGFLTGCNLSLDRVMLEAGMPLPHLASEDAFPAQYRSSLECVPSGAFRGPVVVSLRPVPDELVTPLTALTSRYALSHGAPVHVGDAAKIGIRDLSKVDWGRENKIPPGSTTMFWACGITAQAAAMASRIPEMIVHAPGRMFVTDRVVEEST